MKHYHISIIFCDKNNNLGYYHTLIEFFPITTDNYKDFIDNVNRKACTYFRDCKPKWITITSWQEVPNGNENDN
jgi:hypothetical protein